MSRVRFRLELLLQAPLLDESRRGKKLLNLSRDKNARRVQTVVGGGGAPTEGEKSLLCVRPGFHSIRPRIEYDYSSRCCPFSPPIPGACLPGAWYLVVLIAYIKGSISIPTFRRTQVLLWLIYGHRSPRNTYQYSPGPIIKNYPTLNFAGHSSGTISRGPWKSRRINDNRVTNDEE